MTSYEITTLFRQSKNKREEIGILADLTDSDVETIVQILKDHDLYVKITRCTMCGKLFKMYTSRKCPECEMRLSKQRAQKKAYKKWVDWQINELASRRGGLLRQICMIDKEIENLRSSI